MILPLFYRSVVHPDTGGDTAWRRYALIFPMVLICCLPLAAIAGDALEKQSTPANRIPDVLVYADLGRDEAGHTDVAAVVVDKSRQELMAFSYDGKWRFVHAWPCSTGKKRGAKQREGDQKTPEGIYFVTRNVPGRFLSETYGSRALPLDYPNLADRRKHRTGSAIWLHGTNKKLEPRDSNGCVVMRNKDIDRLARMIEVRKTPVIIVDRVKWRDAAVLKEKAQAILDTVDQWHDALGCGSYNQFESWYDKEAAPGMGWWKQWRLRRNHAAMDNGDIRSRMSGRKVFGNTDGYVVLFDHYMNAGRQSVFVGKRLLFMQVRENRVHIIGDTYQWPSGGHHRLSETDPLFTALKKLRKATDENNGQTTMEGAANDRT